jgi:hypothetical protein
VYLLSKGCEKVSGLPSQPLRELPTLGVGTAVRIVIDPLRGAYIRDIPLVGDLNSTDSTGGAGTQL